MSAVYLFSKIFDIFDLINLNKLDIIIELEKSIIKNIFNNNIKKIIIIN